jgi:choline dehydrogenase-like flavoprotein
MTENWWAEPKETFSLSCEIVIVGSGPGGSFAALTLAEAGFDVILLEKGSSYTGKTVPRNMRIAVQDIYAESAFRTADGFPPTPVAGAQGLGGGTLVNSAICFKTPRRSLDLWNELSENRFSNHKAYYDLQNEIFKIMKVAKTPDSLLSGNDRIHRIGARALGWEEGSIWRNTPACTGCSRCNAVCPSGGKYSMDKGILPRAVEAGARVFTGCQVDGIIEDKVKDGADNSVIGTLFDTKKQKIGTFEVKAKKIIIAAGSIATPELLLQSGFDANNSQIGKGLHLHPVISTWGIMPEPVYQRGATQGHYCDQFSDDWVLLEANPIIGGAFFQSFPIYGKEAIEVMKRASHFVSTGALVKDTTEGEVRLPKDGTSKISYQLNEVDRRRLVKGLRVSAQLYLEGAGAESIVPSVFGGQWCRNMSDVDKFIPENLEAERLVPYSSHAQASCRMGRACDQQGKLLGAKNIYVMDSSVLPSNVGRNPQISIMTVARLLAVDLAEQMGGTVLPLN